MLVSIAAFAYVAHRVTYNTSCGATVTVTYTTEQTNRQIVDNAIAINSALCGTTNVRVTIVD
ncbi:MAG: hypothetical protein ACK5NK_06695 [Niabella sp.]